MSRPWTLERINVVLRTLFACTLITVNVLVVAATPLRGAADEAFAEAQLLENSSAQYREMKPIDYPDVADRTGYCVVLVRLLIDSKGAISDLLALTSEGSAANCESWSARTARSIMAGQWTFEPAHQMGRPVPSEVVIPVVFVPRLGDAVRPLHLPRSALDVIFVSPKA